jgi:EAL domain-containing protein (putative c-di-GMP-specific phosphodiesterase class I)
VSAEPTLELTDSVADAAQAILVSMRDKPAVAVLDVHIPGGGAIAARGIKRCSPKTRVLALSPGDDRETVLEMLEAGADGYLMKGSSTETILTSIERSARGQGSLSVEVTGGVIEELAGLLHARRHSDDRSRRREERVRHAIDDDVVHAVYQPICTLAGSTVGAEALARFRGPPARGPVRWFAEAREVGLLRDLELAAVRAALKGLPELPEHVFLAINVSPATLCTPAFLRLVAGHDGARLVIEITEHARIDDYDHLSDALHALRDFGVRIAIDDAGAGFASLRHILRLEPEFIKLDRTLIDGIEADRSRQALAAGLISFAEKIDATIVAEGIERLAEVEKLSELGVRYGQGYFFARPGPLPLPLLVGATAAGQDAAA